MLFIIKDKNGDPALVVQNTSRTAHQAGLTIKMAVDDLKSRGELDINNLQEALVRNNFAVYGFRTVEFSWIMN